MTPDRTRLILLPGVGADARLFEPQRRAFPNLHVPDWIAPATPRERLEDYAARLAGTIDAADPYYLGGASFGGMVALEVARHLAPKPRALILISSCRSGRSIPPLYRPFGLAVRYAPPRLMRLLHRLLTAAGAALGTVDPRHGEAVLGALRDTPPAFLQWGCSACVRWHPKAAPPGVPVFHVHGDRDRTIPRRLVRPDVTVRGAGHLMNLTHPERVNAFIRDVITGART